MTPSDFLTAMRQFGEPEVPEGGDLKAIIGLYLQALGRFSNEVLHLAAVRVLETRKVRKFPLLADCLQACRDVQEELMVAAVRKNAEQPPASRDDPWTPARIKLADRLMNSEIGRRAAEEGWIISLHDFCREQQRLPDNFEAAEVRTAALERRAERKAREAAFGGNPKIIQAVAAAMEAKAKRLTRLAKLAGENGGANSIQVG